MDHTVLIMLNRSGSLFRRSRVSHVAIAATLVFPAAVFQTSTAAFAAPPTSCGTVYAATDGYATNLAEYGTLNAAAAYTQTAVINPAAVYNNQVMPALAVNVAAPGSGWLSSPIYYARIVLR